MQDLNDNQDPETGRIWDVAPHARILGNGRFPGDPAWASGRMSTTDQFNRP
jgi:hypothetical protein